MSARAPHALRAEVLWTLWLLPLLFAGRVLGQVVAGTLAPSWLPPFEQWDSHTLPYPVLFAGQLVLLGLQGKLALDATRGSGIFAHERPVAARRLAVGARVYACAIVARYVLTMAFVPELRWFGHAIPIAFHCVLAAWVGALSVALAPARGTRPQPPSLSGGSVRSSNAS